MTAKQIAVSASLVVALAGARHQAASADPDGATAADPLGMRPSSQAQGGPGGRFELGAGYGPDDGFIATAEVAQDNLFGRGQALALRAALSARRQLFLVHFDDPHLADSDVGLSVNLFDRTDGWPGFDRKAVGGELSLFHPLGRHARGFVGYRLETVSLSLDPLPSAGAAPFSRAPDGALIGVPVGDARLLRGSLLSSLRAGVIYDTRDLPADPMRGTAAGAWVEAASPMLGGDTRLFRGRAWLARHQPLGPLTLHLELGAAAAVSPDPGGVPLSERLQLDGSSQLLGYRPGSLGPVDPRSGLPLGGNLLASGRVGLEVPLVARLGLAGEVFAGAAGVLDVDGRGPGELGASAGAGLVWHTPFGPVHLDVAMPLGGDRPELILSIGGSF